MKEYEVEELFQKAKTLFMENKLVCVGVLSFLAGVVIF